MDRIRNVTTKITTNAMRIIIIPPEHMQKNVPIIIVYQTLKNNLNLGGVLTPIERIPAKIRK